MAHKPFWSAQRLYLVAAGAAALIFAASQYLHLNSAGHVLLFVFAALIALALAGAAWRRTDEPAREAHKVAAFWGSSFGLLFGLVGLSAAAMVNVPREIWRHADATLFSGEALPEQLVWMLDGALIVSAGSVLGYALIWAAWWLRKPHDQSA